MAQAIINRLDGSQLFDGAGVSIGESLKANVIGGEAGKGYRVALAVMSTSNGIAQTTIYADSSGNGTVTFTIPPPPSGTYPLGHPNEGEPFTWTNIKIYDGILVTSSPILLDLSIVIVGSPPPPPPSVIGGISTTVLLGLGVAYILLTKSGQRLLRRLSR